MKPISPIIILTAVVLALVSPMKAFAQADEEDDKVEDCSTYEEIVKRGEGKLDCKPSEGIGFVLD